MGVKKSTVWTRASSSEKRYTPASSAVSKPTRTLGSTILGIALSTLSNNFGLSLDAQPAAFTWAVSFRENSFGCSTFVYNHKTMGQVRLSFHVLLPRTAHRVFPC